MAVNLSFIGGAGWQFFTDSGVPLNGGKIYTYAAGTTTPLATYTSRTGLIANTNPIILDSAGRTPEQIWSTEGVLYKYVVANSNDVVIRTWDNIGGSVVASNLGQDLADTTNNAKGDALVGFKQSNTSGFLTGATARTVNDKLQESVSVLDFGADPTGNTDSSTKIQAAIDAAYRVYFPSGTYLVQTKLLPSHAVDLVGESRESVTLQLEVNDFGLETTVSGRTVSIRDMTITGDTALAANAGINLFDNGDRPLERLEVHGFARQGIKIVQSVNPILRDIRAYNCSPSQSYGAIHIDKGATACVGGELENCYVGYSTKGVYLNGCRNIAMVNLIIEQCTTGLDTLNTDGLINVGWFEANTTDITCNDSVISRINVASTSTPATFNATFSGSTNPWFRAIPDYRPVFAGMYNSDFRAVSGANTWTTCLFNSNFNAYGASITPFATLGILTKGVYEVEWSATFREITAAVQQVAGRLINGATEIPGSYASATLAASGTVTVSRKVIVNLDVNDTLQFQFSSSSASGRIQSVAVATPTNQTNATFTLRHLGAQQKN